MSKFKWSLGPIATANFGIVFIVLVFNGIIVHQNTMDLHSTQESVNHAYEVLMRTQSLFSSLRDAELNVRNYLASNDGAFLNNYQTIIAKLPEEIGRLRELTRDSEDQSKRVNDLESKIAHRLAYLKNLTSLPTDAARELVRKNAGNEDSRQVETVINEIKNEENRLLVMRTHQQDYRLFMVLAANLVAIIIGSATLMLAWYLVERELRMRRSAESIAHSERQNLLVTLTSIDDGVIVVDASGRVKLVNPSAQQLIGNPRVVVGRRMANIFAIVDETTRKPVENPVMQVLARGKPLGSLGHLVMIRADGTEIPIEQSTAPIQDTSGKVTGVVFVFRDCSVRRQFEREMKDRARRFRRVFETPLIGVAVGTLQGDLLEANDAFLDLIGSRRGDMNDMTPSWADIPMIQIPLDDGAQAEIQEKGVCRPFERTYTRTDGTRVPVLVSAARLPDDQERIVVFVTDLSQSKRAEAALMESEARFRVLSECMPQKVWTARPNGHIDYLNHMLLDYAGRSFEEMRDGGWNDLIHPEDAKLQSEAWKHSLSHGDMFEIELRFRSYDGEYRWHLARALPVYRREGEIAMWVGTYTDIHNQKQAEEALREEHRRKDEFLALLAHELRNPLAPLSNAIQVFPAIQKDPRASDEILKIMHRQVRHMTRLIDDLLDLARITTGRMRLRREKITVSSAVSAAVEAVQPLIAEREHQLDVKVPKDDLWLDADSTRLVQILTNLLNNASKFTDPHGRLSLSVEQFDDEVEFRVGDNGLGISKNMLTKIFDLFTQADVTLDRSHGGLGIGLTLVRTLVELHGGSTTASSEGIGKGSEFRVRLPLVSAPASAALPAPTGFTPAAELTTLPELRVLVVDDVQASAKTLALMLNSLGQKAEMLFDGKSAIEAAAKTPFDLIFLDIAMPGMDGLEAARRIRAIPGECAVTLIALTGFGQTEDRENSFKAGFDEHLTKPVSLDILKEILRQISLKSFDGRNRKTNDGVLHDGVPEAVVQK